MKEREQAAPALGETAKGSARGKTRLSRAQACVKQLPCRLTRAHARPYLCSRIGPACRMLRMANKPARDSQMLRENRARFAPDFTKTRALAPSPFNLQKNPRFAFLSFSGPIFIPSPEAMSSRNTKLQDGELETGEKRLQRIINPEMD